MAARVALPSMTPAVLAAVQHVAAQMVCVLPEQPLGVLCALLQSEVLTLTSVVTQPNLSLPALTLTLCALLQGTGALPGPVRRQAAHQIEKAFQRLLPLDQRAIGQEAVCQIEKVIQQLLPLQWDSDLVVGSAVTRLFDAEALLPALRKLIEREQEAPEALHWTGITVGTKVRVRQGVNPRRGGARLGSVGVVTKLTDSGDCTVDFPDVSGWRGTCEEMQIASAGIAGGCGCRDRVGVRSGCYFPHCLYPCHRPPRTGPRPLSAPML